jgi:hypothetical protein
MTRTPPTPVHVHPAYSSCRRSPYVATFHESSTGLDGGTAPEKKCSQLHLSARLSGPREAVHLSQASVGGRLLGLPGTYHRHAIDTFNTCSRVPTHWSLTDTGEGYHIKNLRIATTPSPPFPSEGSTDPPNGPVGSQIIHNNYQFNWRGKQALNLTSGSLHSTSTVTYHLHIS